MTSRTSTKHKEIQKKCKSKEAARSRRGQQNDEFQELSRQLPLPNAISGQLDRLCIMRLTNSYIKIKKLLQSMMNHDIRQVQKLNLQRSSVYDREALEAMDGFLYVVAPDGQCLYISSNVNHFMGLSQIEVTGNSLYKYVHPCDHEELANQLGGQIPLEDMEIFDGLFCSDSVFMMSNFLKKGSKKTENINRHRSFFLRMKSTLTSRGKSVNLKASTYRSFIITSWFQHGGFQVVYFFIHNIILEPSPAILYIKLWQELHFITRQPHYIPKSQSSPENAGFSICITKRPPEMVVHCTGSMKYTTKYDDAGKEEKVPLFLVAIAVPLMFATTFEVPLDRGTFTSRHMLDMKFLQCDEKVTSLLGYSPKELIGKSWYNFHHAADMQNVLNTHKLLLTKGQSVSKYYRFLVRDGGWVWLQTKAHIVYDSKTCQPQFVFCINYVLGGKQNSTMIMSNEQSNPVPAVNGIYNTLQTEEQSSKDDIVLEERTKLIKQEAKADNKTNDLVTPKKEPALSDCALKRPAARKGKRVCDCMEEECDHMNFQECFPLAWVDVIEQQEAYNKYTWDHYGIAPIETPPMSPVLPEPNQTMDDSSLDMESSAPFLPSPSSDKQLIRVKDEEKEDETMKDDEEDVDSIQNRAPFIPPPSTDAGLMCDDEMLSDVSFGDSSCWLDGSAIKTPYLSAGKIKRPTQSLSALSSPVTLRKVPQSVRRNGYITNELLSTERVCFPLVTQFDAEVNAPVQSCNLLQGCELLFALDQDMTDINSGYLG